MRLSRLSRSNYASMFNLFYFFVCWPIPPCYARYAWYSRGMHRCGRWNWCLKYSSYNFWGVRKPEQPYDIGIKIFLVGPFDLVLKTIMNMMNINDINQSKNWIQKDETIYHIPYFRIYLNHTWWPTGVHRYPKANY